MHTEEPKLSIIIAVMNGARTLERCLDSISRQIFPSYEIVVKDGGSTDGTLQILKRRSSQLAHCIVGADRGIYDAWNTALDCCRGDWICFVGCDDELIGTTSLERMFSRACQSDAPDFVSARAELVDDRGQRIRTIGRAWTWSEMRRHQSVAHPGALHRSTLFTTYGRFDATYAIAGDYEFLLRVGSQLRSAFVDAPMVRIGNNGVSNSRALRAIAEARRAQAQHSEIGRARANLNYAAALSKLGARRVAASISLLRST